MYKVLLHNDASYVQRFCLDIFDVDAFSVNSLLITASRRDIRELYITVGLYLDVCLPPRFLLSDKLVVLKLEGLISINASVSFHLPNLEIIHLKNLNLPDDEYLKKLSSSCPALRELRIESCVVKATTLFVESLTLKSLFIMHTRTIHELEKARIVIKTSNLTCLTLLEFSVSSIDIGDVSSLFEANLNLDDIDSNQAEMILTKVSGVKTLDLNSEFFQLVKKLPVFPNLTWLRCEADSFLSKILNCSPKLKSLYLQYDDSFNPEAAPKHLPCLETVEICVLTGLAEELDTAAYFLKAASALKEMKITFSSIPPCDVTSAYQRLLDLPRSSAVCRIKITNTVCCTLLRWN